MNYKGKHKQLHLNYRQVVGQLGLNKFLDYFTFAFVRNPFSRIVSLYNWIKSESAESNKIDHPGTFENFIKNYENIYKNQLQADFIGAVDFVGRFENLESDWKEVCNLLKVPYIKLDHYKKQNYGDYKDYYNDELISIVRGQFIKDLETFNYDY